MDKLYTHRKKTVHILLLKIAISSIQENLMFLNTVELTAL